MYSVWTTRRRDVPMWKARHSHGGNTTSKTRPRWRHAFRDSSQKNKHGFDAEVTAHLFRFYAVSITATEYWREPVKTATLQNGHNQNGHTEWSHYQNGHTTLVKTATLLWSKRPHRMGSCQNGHAFFGQNGHTLMVKTATRWALPKWAEVATTTATLHLVKTATNNEWYQFCEEWITECVYVTPQNVHNFIVLNWLISVS